jgi:hypothetical protein
LIAAISFLFSNIGQQSSRTPDESMFSTQILHRFATVAIDIEDEV